MEPTPGGDASEEPLPPYAFVPGGPWPHPSRSSPAGGAGRARDDSVPDVGGSWTEWADYRRGIALFNAGYYWEAHEAWEALWHAHGRRGPTADVLKGLIKLAAAGVKVRERQEHGVVTHARRASASFDSALASGGTRQLGLDLGEYIAVSRRIAEDPPEDPGRPHDPVVRVFSFRITPGPAGPTAPGWPVRG